MRSGIYRDREGNLVTLTRTATGYVIRHADGSTTVIGAGA